MVMAVLEMAGLPALLAVSRIARGLGLGDECSRLRLGTLIPRETKNKLIAMTDQARSLVFLCSWQSLNMEVLMYTKKDKSAIIQCKVNLNGAARNCGTRFIGVKSEGWYTPHVAASHCSGGGSCAGKMNEFSDWSDSYLCQSFMGC